MEDPHRLFLQSIWSKRIMTKTDAKDCFRRACERYEDDPEGQTFDDFVKIINKQLQPLYMELRHGVSEDDGLTYYGLVNTSEDEYSKLATNYSPNDIHFFKKVMDQIVQSQTSTALSIDLVHAGVEFQKKIGPSQAEELLAKLTKDQWLSEDQGTYWLGTRSLLELRSYLRRMYEGDVLICGICSDVVVKGQLCETCGIKIHAHCAARFFKGRPNPKCPADGCSEDWLHDIPRLPESERDTTQPLARPSSRPTSSKPSSSRGRRK